MYGILILLSMLPFLIISGLVFWKGAQTVISLVGGWRYLLYQYSAEGMDIGAELRTINFCSAKFGVFANYSKCMRITLTENGLLMVPIFHSKPIFIPWGEVSYVDRSPGLALFGDRYTVQIGMSELKLKGRAGEEVQAFFQHYLT